MAWSTRPLRGMPFWGLQGGKLARKKSKGGGCGAWLSGSIYTLKGGNTQQFFRYFPGADSWQELDTIPAMGTTLKKTRVKGGGDMVYSSLRGLFALKGNKSYEFWRYVHPPEPAGGQPQARGAQAGRSAFVGLRFSVAPNPLTSGFATVHYNAPMAGPVLLSVFDIAGRSVLRTAHSVGRSALSVSLDLRKLANGVYLVRLEAQGQHCTRKLVLARR